MPHSTVSILLPVLNEIDHIDDCLASIAAQEYAGGWEVVVADGGSTDGTLDRLREWAGRLPLRLVDNPLRRQSAGLAAASRAAVGEVLVRMDAHTTYAVDYVSRSVAVLEETEADAVGGPMTAESSSRFGRAVARMMGSRLGMGPAPYRHSVVRRPVDTVYLGTFRAATFESLGGMRQLPSGVAEDADFYFRLRRSGGTVILDPGIASRYTPRDRPADLARQYWRYGMGKADMLYVNGRLPSWRPAAPTLLALGLTAATILGPVWGWWPLFALLAAWLGGLAVAARGRVLDLAVGAIMHLAYGFGLLRGLLRSPPAVRAAVVSHQP